ncbi:MAG: RNA polymerase sigma factor [Acidobacteria bacterium]|nr:RNA polymerase sigma factor [Acidobacteriota bacterium]
MDSHPATSSDSPNAFSEAVAGQLPVLLRVARTMTSTTQDAEDLVQETLVLAFRHWSSFDGRYLRSWLFTIMRNAHASRHRRRRLDEVETPSELVDDRHVDPADAAAQSGFRDAVGRALEHLDERYRQVVILVDVEGCSYAEAAVALDVPSGTVMSRLHRARRDMRRLLESWGYGPGKE